jgi:hypothetical protein
VCCLNGVLLCCDGVCLLMWMVKTIKHKGIFFFLFFIFFVFFFFVFFFFGFFFFFFFFFCSFLNS